MHQMFQALDLRLNAQMHNDLLQKLNVLYTVQDDPQVRTLLNTLVPTGKSLEQPQYTRPVLDAFGRSHTVASRKTARAQVWLVPGSGLVCVNGRSLVDYFPNTKDRARIIEPFNASDLLAKFNVWAISQGGGQTGIVFNAGQADAIAVAVARGICVHSTDTAEILDPRLFS